MVMASDPCLFEGLGRDTSTGQIGMFNLRSVAWPYAAAITAKTGLKKDAATGFPYTDPVDGVIEVGNQSAGRSYGSDPGTAGVSMLAGGLPYLETTITNSGVRSAVAFVHWEWNFRCFIGRASSSSSQDFWSLGPAATIGVGSPGAAPPLSYDYTHEHMGGLASPVIGFTQDTVNYGGLRKASLHWGVGAGQTLYARCALGFSRGSAGFQMTNSFIEVAVLICRILMVPYPPAS